MSTKLCFNNTESNLIILKSSVNNIAKNPIARVSKWSNFAVKWSSEERLFLQHCIICLGHLHLIALRHYWRYRVIFRSCQYLLHCYKDLIDLDYNIKMSLFEISESAENCSVELFLVYILTVSDYMSHRSLMEQIYDTPRKNIHLCPWST